MDNENRNTLTPWMTSLPERLTHEPLGCLAIPGTHDSGSFRLYPDLGMVVNTPTCLRVLVRLTCSVGTSVVYNWSKTQNLTILEQLKAGIRYFDLRIASHPDTHDIRFIHGLYGDMVKSAFADVRLFLDANPKEVLILDFNHFNNMSQSDHSQLLNEILNSFKGLLVPQPAPSEDLLKSMNDLTLANLWTTSYRVIVIYQNSDAASLVPGCNVWSKSHIESFWANTADINILMERLGEVYSKNKRPDNYNLYSWQGILTPSTRTVLCHLCSTLENQLGKRATERYTDWLNDKIPAGCETGCQDGSEAVEKCSVDKDCPNLSFCYTPIRGNAAFCCKDTDDVARCQKCLLRFACVEGRQCQDGCCVPNNQG